MKTRSLLTGFIGGVVGAVLLALLAWLGVIYTGAYNVAATDPHADVVRWSLDTSMHRSVARRAGGADLPDSVTEELVAEGAEHYAESCVYCHGAPGVEPAGWSRGLRPEPPHLVEAAEAWSLDEIHWIVTNGIKMTGMPAFGPHHDPAELVALAGFVKALPGLAAEDYRVMTGASEASRSPSK